MSELPDVGQFNSPTTTELQYKEAQAKLIEFVKNLDGKISALGSGRYGVDSYATAEIIKTSLPAGTIIEVGNDPDSTKNGSYIWDGTTLTKSDYDPKNQAIAVSKDYADNQKVQKYTAINRLGVLYEVTDNVGNQTWLQVSDADGMPTTFAKMAIRQSASIDDTKVVLVDDGILLHYLNDASGNPTALAVRQSDGMFPDFVIADIKNRLSIDSNAQYKPKPSDFQVLSSIARGVARNVAGVALPNKKTDFINSRNQNNRLTFPNSYNDATPLILVICFEGVGDQALDIRGAYSDVLNKGVLWARSQFHGDSYGNAKAMQDAKELYEKACAVAPIGGVIIVGNSMGGIAALNCLTNEAVPNVLGVYLTDPAYDLRQRYDNGRSNEINAAYECDATTYAVKTSGYDPALKHWSEFKGVPFSIVATSNDTLVTMTAHTNQLVAKLSGHNSIRVIDTKASGHNAPEEFIVSNLISFINQCASGAVITAI